jgi:hypothetical protein
MAGSRRFLRAAFGSTAIVGCVALGVAVMSDTYAGNNFSGAFGGQCKIVNGTNGRVKGLAIGQGSAKGLCVCPSQASYQNYRRRYPGEESENCIIQNPQNKITNFNRPPAGQPGGEPGGGEPGGGEPGGGEPGGGQPGGGEPGGGQPGGGQPGGGQPGGNPARADNGWGNGPDPENPGSFHGNGVARGGPGAGQSQTASKNSNPDQR